MKATSAFGALATAVLLATPVVLGETIAQIQGPSHYSPFAGKTVTDVRGIVTMKNGNGFFLQSVTPDSDDKTSEGVLVFFASATAGLGPQAKALTVGQYVSVAGQVQEYFSPKYKTDLFATEITAVTNITVLAPGPSFPAPVVIGQDGRMPPTSETFYKFDDGYEALSETITTQATFQTYGDLDIKNRGLDFLESLEGMLVTIKSPIVTGQPDTDSSFWVLPEGGKGATGVNAAGGISMSYSAEGTDNNPERFLISKSPVGQHAADLAIGDAIGDITGVLTYNAGMYSIIPNAPASIIKRNTNAMAFAPPTDKSEFGIAAFNTENFAGNADQAKFDEVARQIIDYLGSPSILLLNEIQDNDGTASATDSDSSVTVKRVTDAISAAGGPNYKATWINPVSGADGGEPGGNIRQVVFYDEAQGVTLTAGTAGDATTGVSVVADAVGKPSLSLNPGRVDPANPSWLACRKALAVSFDISGERVFVLANHLSSKLGGSNLYGAVQPYINGAVVKRQAQAQINRDFAATILAQDPSANIIVLGDLNEFAWGTPIQALLGKNTTTPLFDLGEETLPVVERYSYNYQGQSQELDHIIISKNLLDRTTKFVPVHVNTWGPLANRTSDHDPQYARFKRTGSVAPATSTIASTSTATPGTSTSTPGTSTIATSSTATPGTSTSIPVTSTIASTSTATPGTSTSTPGTSIIATSSTATPISIATPGTSTIATSATSAAESISATSCSESETEAPATTLVMTSSVVTSPASSVPAPPAYTHIPAPPAYSHYVPIVSATSDAVPVPTDSAAAPSYTAPAPPAYPHSKPSAPIDTAAPVTPAAPKYHQRPSVPAKDDSSATALAAAASETSSPSDDTVVVSGAAKVSAIFAAAVLGGFVCVLAV
ncbi:hypothetical protein HKX48_005724 [Thoreauomyces humboldtii]|nr:hypothetical protein HKX48_005724 [Thoreauomyces humboldtii]